MSRDTPGPARAGPRRLSKRSACGAGADYLPSLLVVMERTAPDRSAAAAAIASLVVMAPKAGGSNSTLGSSSMILLDAAVMMIQTHPYRSRSSLHTGPESTKQAAQARWTGAAALQRSLDLHFSVLLSS